MCLVKDDFVFFIFIFFPQEEEEGEEEETTTPSGLAIFPLLFKAKRGGKGGAVDEGWLDHRHCGFKKSRLSFSSLPFL